MLRFIYLYDSHTSIYWQSISTQELCLKIFAIVSGFLRFIEPLARNPSKHQVSVLNSSLSALDYEASSKIQLLCS